MCHFKAFESIVITFGHKNAPANFYNSTNLMLHNLLEKGVLIYIDAILEKRTSDIFKMEGLGVNVDDQEGHNETTYVE